MSWTGRPWLRRTLTAWREVSAAARLALSASSARNPRRSLTTLLCSLLRSFSSYSKGQRSVVSEKRARRPRSQPCPHRNRNRNTLSLPTGDHESPHTPGVRGANSGGGRMIEAPTPLPRAHGANLRGLGVRVRPKPLPPHAWGELAQADLTVDLNPSTPACAGQTPRKLLTRASGNLYPRVRGANAESIHASAIRGPLPPRARGKRRVNPRLRDQGASTPACAGQTG